MTERIKYPHAFSRIFSSGIDDENADALIESLFGERPDTGVPHPGDDAPGWVSLIADGTRRLGGGVHAWIENLAAVPALSLAAGVTLDAEPSREPTQLPPIPLAALVTAIEVAHPTGPAQEDLAWAGESLVLVAVPDREDPGRAHYEARLEPTQAGQGRNLVVALVETTPGGARSEVTLTPQEPHQYFRTPLAGAWHVALKVHFE